jgi:hypothetical protein
MSMIANDERWTAMRDGEWSTKCPWLFGVPSFDLKIRG